jgi:hypothetical protein
MKNTHLTLLLILVFGVMLFAYAAIQDDTDEEKELPAETLPPAAVTDETTPATGPVETSSTSPEGSAPASGPDVQPQ